MPPQPGKVATAEALDQFDAIFSMALKFTADSVRGLERLALVARWGVGYDMIDVDALTAADIALAITPNAVRRPVAEAILTFIFVLSKNLFEQDRITRAGKWRGDLSHLGTTLEGKTLGSVGCGNIGRELFRLARGLGFGRFLACDPYVNEAPEVVELVSLETLMRESDFVSINCLLNAETRGLIGEPQFRMMKPTAFFINTARGPIVDQGALTRALREKWIAAAGIDVFEQEPIDPHDPLLGLDNLILAPHALAWTTQIARDNGLEACDHILAVSRGDAPASIVNREVLQRPGFQKKLRKFGQQYAAKA
jgi:phosphoglycerate dehydrogenase-like enzyme